MQFDSHLKTIFNHDMYEDWDEWDIDLDDCVLIAYNPERQIIYSYRVIIDEFG